MISLTCTNCQTTLSIDDAFAGGVCRCQHCGTIQTVPAVRRKSVSAAAGDLAGEDAAAVGGVENASPPRAARAAMPTAPVPAPNMRVKGILIAAAVALVVIIAVIIWLSTARNA